MPPCAITEHTLYHGDNLPILRDNIASASEQQRRRRGGWRLTGTRSPGWRRRIVDDGMDQRRA
jgi:hypothetical protein